MNSKTIVVPDRFIVTQEQFEQIAIANRDLRLERTAKGELIVMPPAGSETGRKNADISGQLYVWNKKTKLGFVFDSSAGFILPNGAERSPDASWIEKSRWEALTKDQREKFAPICPDFVIELKSPSDRLKTIEAKMEEYIENGAKMGWLIEPENKQVQIYCPDRAVEICSNLSSVSGRNLLPEFELDLTEIWN